MHKSPIILLDKIFFWGLNRSHLPDLWLRAGNRQPNSLLSGKGCTYFFDDHKTMVQMVKNSLKQIRESLLMSKSELAREANISPITITRIEEGKPCRLETKRKILLALGYSLSDSKKIFGE